MTTFVSVSKAGFVWLGTQPAVFVSSENVRRLFCRDCGSPIAYEHDSYPNEIHLYLMTIDPQPKLAAPERHDFWHERVPWLRIEDDLPKS